MELVGAPARANFIDQRAGVPKYRLRIRIAGVKPKRTSSSSILKVRCVICEL